MMTHHYYSYDPPMISFHYHFSYLLSTRTVLFHVQVQHILASTSPSGRSVVWDLRKNEPIITVADTSTMVNCSYVAMVPVHIWLCGRYVEWFLDSKAFNKHQSLVSH